jgi:PilZ domain
MQKMRESLYAKMRDKPRFNVNFKAKCIIKEQGAQQQECLITNLSATGAAVRFSRTESISKNIPVVIDIPIPNTIMHVSAVAEIVWVKQRFNELISGVRFMNILSDSMIQRLVKKTQ